METKQVDRVRALVRSQYIEPARRRGDVTVRVVVGEIQKRVGLVNRVPLVVQALKGKKFLQENGLKIEKCEGPPSGLSTTVSLTYRLEDKLAEEEPEGLLKLLNLAGIGKDRYPNGELSAFILSERKSWDKERS